MNLAKDHIPGSLMAPVGIVRNPVLLLAQEHVSPGRAADPGQKPAPGGEKTQMHFPLSARAHQGGTGAPVGKGNDIFQNL